MRDTSLTLQRIPRSSRQLFVAVATEAKRLLMRRWVQYLACSFVLAASGMYAVAATRVSGSTLPATVSQGNEAFEQSTPDRPVQTLSTIHSDTTTVSSGTAVSGSSASSTSVTVNGETVAVPANGSVSKTVTSADGETTIDVSHSSSGTGTDTSTTSLRLNVTSRSEGGSSDE